MKGTLTYFEYNEVKTAPKGTPLPCDVVPFIEDAPMEITHTRISLEEFRKLFPEYAKPRLVK